MGKRQRTTAGEATDKAEKDFVKAGKPSKPKSQPDELPEDRELVPITVRVDAEIASRLRRASFERREARLRPWKQGDIVSIALDAWLLEAGF